MDTAEQAAVIDPARRSRRWAICGLLFAATTLNYVDRQVIAILKPTLAREFGWSEADYASIVFWFQLSYAVGLVSVGRLLDCVGVRRGFAKAVGLWSVATAAHSLARSVGGFSLMRVALGLSEAANFPAAVKTVAEWFPRAERALATGIFNAGANVGALATALCVPPLVLAFGWRAAFFATGGAGLLWLVLWLLIYRAPPTSAAVAADLGQGPAGRSAGGWREALAARETWAYAAGKFMTDPIWWFFLFWLPDYFEKAHGLNLKSFGPPLVAIYLVSDVGSIAGGGLSSFLVKRGCSLNAGRKTAMLVCALLVTPIALAAGARDVWLATALIALAAAAHQAWSANLLSLPADTVPNRLVGSVVGFGGMAGAVGGMLMAKYAGHVLQTTGSYNGLFALIAATYLAALLVIHLIAPKLQWAGED
jgi:ACS family hexuronate transporter-like MFS transporter